MNKITFFEFGVTSIIHKFHKMGNKLKGMRNGKPFTKEGKIFINIEENLNEVDSIEFRDNNGKKIERKNVCLDTVMRISGIVHNDSEILLLKNLTIPNEFYCFPGGHKREGETEEEALVREMLEETGINIKKARISLLKELQQQGFGPEHFYLIDLGNSEINFIDELGTEGKTALVIVKIQDLNKIKKLYPKTVVEELIENLSSC